MGGGDNGHLSRTVTADIWVRQNVGTTAAINDIYFRDKEAGFLLAGNAIYVTRDNGNAWTQSRIFLPEEFEGADVELYSVRFSSKNKGWVVGSVSKRERVIDSILAYTDDGGETWRRQRAPSRTELTILILQRQTRLFGSSARRHDSFHARRRRKLAKQNVKTTRTLYHVDFRDDKKAGRRRTWNTFAND